ncbi:inositol polyphosphate multikinase beta-like [Impatiens glandulifera]|uniref:inositol polyphosphate multikinase beta-like n=1 Tax=Impatiens glandulifera TaxID=253017 RepID=UPI001FB06C3D|nr:inositol polyphosphate multikinase beta-like [Impatiens glandulifera]
MFKIPDHQVAGHQASDGSLGPLIDDSGRFYKPLQSDDRGSNEMTFYTSFSSNGKIPDHIRKFFPVFYGTQDLQSSDGSGLRPHLVLENLVSSHVNPSIMDVKIGARTWPHDSSEDYIAKCLKKDRETTTVSLGFRVSGFHIYNDKKMEFWKPDRKWVLRFSHDDVRVVLRKFVSSNASEDQDQDSSPDCALASVVYGGSTGILAQLLELKEWFEDQSMYHFHSCSVIMMHSKELGAVIKLVDFAHVLEGKGVIDHNFLGGICSLIKFISDILISQEEEQQSAKHSIE